MKKAKLNLEWYDGKDSYTDGEIENYLLEIARIYKGKDLDQIINLKKEWPVLYHFSKMRENILNWFPFDQEASLLEIGSGCGALTGLFCRKVKNVKSIELSKRRALVNYERNESFTNLEIIVGNFERIKFNMKFDYITLIGVLEYSQSFITHGSYENPYVKFLCKIKEYMKKDGILFIAIENRFGLKYFAGAKEDHTGKVFDGITGYLASKKIKTFGKVELEELLRLCGYNDVYFYYPHPDYKMPTKIFSQDHLPNIDSYLESAPNFDRERYKFFSEKEAFMGIILNKQYEFFANSFLILCKLEKTN